MAFVLTLAFLNGCATVISKMINYRCTKYLGTNNGSLVNYVVASVLSLVLLLVFSGSSADLNDFRHPLVAVSGRSFWHCRFYYIYDHTLPPEGDGVHHPSSCRAAHSRNSF